MLEGLLVTASEEGCRRLTHSKNSLNMDRNLEGSDSLYVLMIAMPRAGMKDLSCHCSVSEQLIYGIICAPRSLSQNLKDVLGHAPS